MKIDIYQKSQLQNIPHVDLVVVYKTETDNDYIANIYNENDLMNCMIVTTEGNGLVKLKNKHAIELPEKSVFWGRMPSISYLKSKSTTWKFNCYWFISYGIDIPENVCITISNLDIEKENNTVLRILSYMQSNTLEELCMANGLFQYRLLKYVRVFSINHQTTSNKLFNEIIYFINTHLKENLTVHNIAKKFNYSEKHIRNVIKKQLNLTPSQYILNKKLEQIYNLLQSSSLSIENLAEMYNFASTSALIIHFKKRYGTTPHQTRLKQILKNNNSL